MDWLWPLTLVLFAIQAVYAASRRLVNPFLGFFISSFDVLIALDAVLRSDRGARHDAARSCPALPRGDDGRVLRHPRLADGHQLTVLRAGADDRAGVPRAAARDGHLPVLSSRSSPAHWVVIFITQLTPARQAVGSYRIHDPQTEKLQERPDGDFAIGLKLFPDLDGPPPPVAIRNDLSLADTLQVSVVSVTIVPEEMDRLALDSLANALELLRRDSTQLIVTLGYPSRSSRCPAARSTTSRVCKTIDRIVRRLHPDILLPAEDPYGAGTRAAGQRAPQYWQSYLTRAAAIAKRADRHVRIGVSASSYDRRDSTLYAWAAKRGSPVDVVGFTLYPSRIGVRTLDAATHAADRWMRESNSTKEHWVFAAGGFPEAHGEASQERAIWAALAWATSRPAIKGLIVSEAGDYGTITGLRAPDGHLRRVIVHGDASVARDARGGGGDASNSRTVIFQRQPQ